MRLGYDLTIEQTQKLTMTPELIQAIKILQFNSQELEDFVSHEIMENPVLELDSSHGQEGETIEASKTESILEIESEEADFDLREKILENDYDDISYKQWDFKTSKEEGITFDQYTSKEETLQDFLISQLMISKLEGDDKTIGRYLLEAIDDNGYLTIDTDSVAKAFSVTLEKVENILDVIQTFEPCGVGARTLEECLIIQLASKGLLENSIEYIILNHLNDLGDNRIQHVSKVTGLPVIQVQMIVDLIRTLEPKPGRQYASGDQIRYVVPDIIVEKEDKGYVVLTNDNTIPHLMVSPYYVNLAKTCKDDEELQKYISDKYNSAIWLIKSIEQRKQTIYNVACAVVNHQIDFLDKGDKYIKTMTLKQIADVVGVHESTVSRSINGKYIQTPRGVFEIKYFFSSGVSNNDGEGLSSNSIKKLIKELIDNEDSKRPLSDQEMVSMLSQKGIEISRRTIAKYRESMNILSSSKRRRY